MRRHPAGKERPDEAPAEPDRRYVVREGDTLWSIAERELQTDDLRAIARFWPQIHRANRTTIGADPSLILPGQVLVIPNVKEG
jgi:nucleoid-associated protein YgaU